MIGTNEEYNGVPLLTYESSGGQGDLTTGCGSCRKKISEATFDMTAGFNLKTSTSPAVSSRDRLNAEQFSRLNQRRLSEEHIEISTKKGDCNCGCKDKQLKISTVTPQTTAIDQLYGRKMPDFHYKNTDNQFSPVKKDSENILVYTKQKDAYKKQCCLPSASNGILLINPPFNDNYILSFTLDYNKYTIFWESYPFDVSIEDCCLNLKKDIWCLTNIEDIDKQYEIFWNCVRNKIIDKLTEVIKNLTDQPSDISPFIPDDFIEQLDKVQNFVEISKNNFINYLNKSYDLTESFGYGRNEDCCLCGGNVPTVCCNPSKENKECWCPDGSLKNLCKDCEDNSLNFWIPIALQFQKYPAFSCVPYYFDKISYILINLDNYSIIESNNNIIVGTLETPDTGGDGFKILPIKIPSDNLVMINLTIQLSCGRCCDKNYRREVRKTIVFRLKDIPSQDLEKFLQTAFGDDYVPQYEDTGCIFNC